MASINKVILVGNLGRDPEIRTFQDGGMVCNITVATTSRWNDKASGESQEHTEWHRVSFTGKLAEIANNFLRKGSQVYVEGALRTRKWTDTATGQERYTTEIRAEEMQMLGPRPDDQGRSQQGQRASSSPQSKDDQASTERTPQGEDSPDDLQY